MTKKLIERLFPARKKARRRTKFLTLESLESRELFSVSPGPFSSLSGNQPAQISTVTPRLSFQDVESNNTLATANNVGTVSAGASSSLIYGHIGNRIGRVVDSQDWYKIDVRGRTDATFTLSSMTRDLDLYLFNSQGREVTRSNNSGTRVDEIRRTLDPGTYFVQVRQFSSNVSVYTLRMNLNVQAAPEQPVTPTGPDVEPNNERAQASNLGLFAAGANTRAIAGNVGGTVAGSLDSQDWYRFEVAGRTVAQLRLTGLTQDLDLFLYNSSGTQINSSDNAGTQDDTITATLEPGTYFVQIRQYDGSASAYSLGMDMQVQAAPEQPVTPAGPDIEPNNERAQASNLGLFTAGNNTRTIDGNAGGTVAGSLDSQDWYRFEVAGRTAAQLRLTGLTQDLDLFLYNSSGTQINSSDNAGTQDDTITATLEQGTYFVQVRQYDGSASAYSLRLNMDVQAPTQPTQPTPPNPRLQAIHLGDLPPFGQTWQPLRSQPTAHISNSRREIYYSFDNDSTRRVQLDLRSISANLNIELQNADGVVVARSTNAGLARDLIATSITPGRWFIRIYQGTSSANSRIDLRIAALS